MILYLKMVVALILPLFLLLGAFGCGDGGGGGSSTGSEASGSGNDNDVDSNQGDQDNLLTGEGIIDPIELSSGQAGTETPNTARIRFNTALGSPSTPIVLESLIVVDDDLCKGHPLNLFSNSESYDAVEAARRAVAHIEKYAIYTNFRAERSGSTVTIEAPRNLPYKYRRQPLRWKFLLGASQSVSTITTTMDGFSPGTPSFYSHKVITLHADLPADADDHEITIDGVSIDLGTGALTREEIAQRIANTDFSSGDSYTSVGAYYVGASGNSLLFQRRDSNVNLDGSINIEDNAYTGTILNR